MFSKKNHQWRLENILPLHEMLQWDHIGLCAQAQTFLLHENPPRNENWKYIVQCCLPNSHPSQKLRSWSPLIFMPSTRLLLSMVVKAYIKLCLSLWCHKSLLLIFVLHFPTKNWEIPINLYSLSSWIALIITLFELKDFNQHLVFSNSTLKPFFVNWLIDWQFFANFGTYNTSPIHLEILFGKLKTIVSFSHTSKILLSPKYTLWFKVNSSKVDNTSFWKVKCCEALELINYASLQILEIDEKVTRSSIFLVVATCEKPLNLFFPILLLLVTFSCKLALGGTIVVSSFLLLLPILELFPIDNPFELPRNTHNS